MDFALTVVQKQGVGNVDDAKALEVERGIPGHRRRRYDWHLGRRVPAILT
jgi:hypothetical protein